MATGDASVGRFMWKRVRNYVLAMQHHGYDISLTEGEGFLSRPFYFRGSNAAIQHIYEWIKSLERE